MYIRLIKVATSHIVAILTIALCICSIYMLNVNAGTHDITVDSTEAAAVDLEGDSFDIENTAEICDGANITIRNGIIDCQLTLACSNCSIRLEDLRLNDGIVITGSGNSIVFGDGCSLVPAYGATASIVYFNAVTSECSNNTISITSGQYNTSYFINYLSGDGEAGLITDPSLNPGGNRIVLYGGYYSIPVPSAICGKDTEHGIVYEPGETDNGKPLAYCVVSRDITPSDEETTPENESTKEAVTSTSVSTGDASPIILCAFTLISSLALSIVFAQLKRTRR